MTAQSVLQGWEPRLQAMIAAKAPVDGWQIVRAFQRDMARDKAEQIFMQAATSFDMTEDDVTRLFDQGAWVLLTALQETALHYGMTPEQVEELKQIIGASINERMDELCGASSGSEITQ